MKYDQKIIDEWERKGMIISNTPCGSLSPSHYDAPFVSFELPIKTTTESNSGGHWKSKYYRGKRQIAAIQEKLSIYPAQLLLDLSTSCVVTLTRVASRELDSDNLQSAFKHIRDAIAQTLLGGTLGQMDSDPRLQWEYKQVKSQTKGYYGVIVTIQPREVTAS